MISNIVSCGFAVGLYSQLFPGNLAHQGRRFVPPLSDADQPVDGCPL